MKLHPFLWEMTNKNTSCSDFLNTTAAGEFWTLFRCNIFRIIILMMRWVEHYQGHCVSLVLLNHYIHRYYSLNTVLWLSTWDTLNPWFRPQIFIKMQIQWQFWILLVLRILKHPQHVEIDLVLTELFEVKDKWYHSQNFQ